MAVIATLTKGYDLDYIWRQVDRSATKDAAGYYIQASESGGEPPGRWWGPGAKALGLEHGQIVERGPYDLLFGERKAADGTQLGRPPGGGQNAADIYTRLLAAEPHATAERQRELRTEATRQAGQSPLYFDLTLSLSKSISIFHASLGENARLAREAGVDGKWRAPDSLGYNEHIGAVAAITAQHLEEALTRRFGVQWTARDDGHGFEIKGISGQMMRLFSSRRESITADLRVRAARFEQRYGRAPSQRELAQLAQASNFTTRKAKDGALDFAQMHKGWADKLTRTLGVPLASVAPSVWHAWSGHGGAGPLEGRGAARRAGRAAGHSR